MSHNDLSRRSLLRAGSGLFAASLFGACSSSRDTVITTPGSTSSNPANSSTSSTSSIPEIPATGAAQTTTTLQPIPAPPGSTRFVPVRPERIVDTRGTGEWTLIAPGRTRVPIVGHAGVPDLATAAALRVTAVGNSSGPDESGIAIVPAESTDSGGVRDAGLASSATSFVLLGDGKVDVLHALDDPGLTVDVLGYFEPVGAAAGAGRVVTVEPTTIIDTAASARPFEPSESRPVTPDGSVLPGARAVLVQVTASSATAGGGWTVLASTDEDGPPVLTSGPEMVATASTVVRLADGGFEVTSESGGHVSIDVVGYVTGDDAPVSIDGFYVPTMPTRLLDTRQVRQPIPNGSSREMEIGTAPYGAVALNLTTRAVIGSPATSAWAAGALPRFSAAVAPGAAGVGSHQAVLPAGARGVAVGVVGGSAHVVADLYGWFVGTRSAATVPVLGSQPLGIQGVEMESYADEWLDYGTSTDGRPLRAFRYGSGSRVGLITTGLHGNELTGTSVLADLVTRGAIPGWTLWLVPVANPDARALNTRYVHDVDMNRDFPVDWNLLPRETNSGCVTTRTGPEPHTLVESRELAAAMLDGPFSGATISISHHDNYNWVAPQSGSPPVLRELANEYADATGLRRPGEGGNTVPTSPRSTHVDGGFETFAASLGMSSFLIENKAGYVGGSWCAGSFGLQPTLDDVVLHHDALQTLLDDGRLPAG